MKNTGQLDPTRNLTQSVTRLTCNPIDPFKNDLFWSVTRFNPRLNWPVLPHPIRFAMSTTFYGQNLLIVFVVVLRIQWKT